MSEGKGLPRAEKCEQILKEILRQAENVGSVMIYPNRACRTMTWDETVDSIYLRLCAEQSAAHNLAP